METNSFVRIVSPKIKAMLDQAMAFMTNTKDLSHGIDHVNHLLKDIHRFLESTGNQFNLDKEILLLAVYWHDVWKSQNKPTLANYLFQQLYEGWGSMLMFRKYARDVGLLPCIIRPVSYAIRKHSAIQSLPAKTLEAQLLWDVDTLDVWNSQRVQTLFKNLGWTNISMFDSYILYMKKIGFPLNFEWTRNELKRLKPLFFEEMSKFREGLGSKDKSHKLLFFQSISADPHNHRSIQSLRELDHKS